MLIAERLLKISSSGTTKDVFVRLNAPQKQSESSWSCVYEIEWPERPKKMTVWGADSMQTIVLALQMIGADLYTSNYHKAGELLFEKIGGGYGFPVGRGTRDLLEGDDAKFL